MYDQIFDRQYQSGRKDLHDGIDRLGRAVSETFRTIHRVQFEAPWAKRDAHC